MRSTQVISKRIDQRGALAIVLERALTRAQSLLLIDTNTESLARAMWRHVRRYAFFAGNPAHVLIDRLARSMRPRLSTWEDEIFPCYLLKPMGKISRKASFSRLARFLRNEHLFASSERIAPKRDHIPDT
jgi:hypothetical protein